MTETDIGLLIGKLVASWSLGFAAGFILTRFREALNHAT